jgi:hypothetical protein
MADLLPKCMTKATTSEGVPMRYPANWASESIYDRYFYVK